MRKAAERAAAYLVPAQREEPHAGSFSLWRLLGVVTFVGVVVTFVGVVAVVVRVGFVVAFAGA